MTLQSTISTLSLEVQKLEANKKKLATKLTKMEQDLLNQGNSTLATLTEITDLNNQLLQLSDKYSKSSDELFAKKETILKLESENKSKSNTF